MNHILQEDCDVNKPEEAFAWALTALPMPKGSPLMLHPSILKRWSKHLWELGFRQYPSEQQKVYHPPHRGQQHWLNSSGAWYPKDHPRPPRVTAPDMSRLTAEERVDVIRQLREFGDLKDQPVVQDRPSHIDGPRPNGAQAITLPAPQTE